MFLIGKNEIKEWRLLNVISDKAENTIVLCAVGVGVGEGNAQNEIWKN